MRTLSWRRSFLLTVTGSPTRIRPQIGRNGRVSGILEVRKSRPACLTDFDSGTRLRSFHSTCSHLAWVISLRRAPVSINNRIALAADPVLVDGDRIDKPLRLFPGQETIALRLVAKLDAAARRPGLKAI